MTRPRPLPPHLGSRFSVTDAKSAGIDHGRLRRADLKIPFRGVRAKHLTLKLEDADAFARQRAERIVSARNYAPRLKPDQLISHESAVAVFGGPMPLILADGTPVDGRTLPVHVSTRGAGALVRATGVQAHRIPADAAVLRRDALAAVAPAMAWAQMGAWDLLDLVALGDYFCRVYRPGYGRRDVGRQPWATIAELRATIASGRRVGIARLREAVELIREDSWSPRESMLRCRMVLAGLPEPLLNHDVYDDRGRFLGCVDLAYPHLKVAIEYQGALHHASYAADVERIAALRAAGWIVIEVTNDLFRRPADLIARIRRAIGG